MDTYQTTIATWDKIAALYQEHFMHLDLYNESYDIFCNAINKQPASIFEIGCGPGNITRYLLSKRKDFIIDGTDVSPNMVAHAKQNNPGADFFVLDARQIDTITKQYDGIMCGFCLPYLSKEDYEKLVTDCFKLLYAGGIFYCSAIEGEYIHSRYETGSSGDKAFVYYYDQPYLEEQLRKNGFTDVQTYRIPYTRKDDSKETHLIIIAKKNKMAS